MLAAVLLLGVPASASAHPLHTTISTVLYTAETGVLAVSIRLFADDFSAVVSGRPAADPRHDALPPDSAMFRYVIQRLEFVTRDDRGTPIRVPLTWCGAKRDGAVIVVCVRGAARTLRDAQVRNRLMSDVFNDQINMMKVTRAGPRHTLLFTRRDGAKPLG